MNYEYKEEHHLHDLSVCHSDISRKISESKTVSLHQVSIIVTSFGVIITYHT